jgi:hypothetical protein
MRVYIDLGNQKVAWFLKLREHDKETVKNALIIILPHFAPFKCPLPASPLPLYPYLPSFISLWCHNIFLNMIL